MSVSFSAGCVVSLTKGSQICGVLETGVPSSRNCGHFFSLDTRPSCLERRGLDLTQLLSLSNLLCIRSSLLFPLLVLYGIQGPRPRAGLPVHARPGVDDSALQLLLAFYVRRFVLLRGEG